MGGKGFYGVGSVGKQTAREAVWDPAAGPGAEDVTSARVPVHLCQSLWRRVWLYSDCGFLLLRGPGWFLVQKGESAEHSFALNC